MPEYDTTNYPDPLAADLTTDEPGRDNGGLPSAWPRVPHVHDPYDGPPPSREFETSGGPRIAGRPVPTVAPPTEKPQTSIVPPPGHG